MLTNTSEICPFSHDCHLILLIPLCFISDSIAIPWRKYKYLVFFYIFFYHLSYGCPFCLVCRTVAFATIQWASSRFIPLPLLPFSFPSSNMTLNQFFSKLFVILPDSAPCWILSLAENLASSILQDGVM